ncbi:MAG: glucosylglycerol hydrolase [Pseudomonadota bacterium]|nr:glucosylglycerol hydrolase [Pseudomonadota bacterium]
MDDSNATIDSAPVTIDEAATQALADWVDTTWRGADSVFHAAQEVAVKLGAHRQGDLCEILIWAPVLLENRVPDAEIFIEVLDAGPELNLQRLRHSVDFRRTLVPVSRVDAWCMAAISGMRPGSREQVGSFYALTWRDAEGDWHRIYDPLASSVPFGVFAPAEYYDVEAMQAARGDLDYYAQLPTDEVYKFGPVTNILQVHVPTATAGCSLASFARHIELLAARVKEGRDLEPADRIFLGYDAVQLLPVEPTTVYEAGPAFWTELEFGENSVTVDLRRPDTINWGYDIVISGMATVNPAMLESGRPDELIDVASALHNFPGKPKKLIFDVVYGHSDNQGLNALNYHFFAGPNMYGQNINFRHPVVRAILLEMQRRKVDFGADGVRVDGAQDFQWWDADSEVMRHDDDYLQEMADVVQNVAGRSYRPWFVFEDGRPWPDEDWELSSTYRDVIETQRDPDVFQWGPLTFAHNTPFLYTFWLSKFWRIEEILHRGSNWISGCANHDTLRRGTQINPELNINTRLGDTQMEILDKAYDNPGVQLLTYAVFPGVPMDFLNAMARASWGFIRNQDDQYGVKIVSEEAISLVWQVDSYSYSRPGYFRRLKELGFENRNELGRFLDMLATLVKVTEYDLRVMSHLLNQVEPPLAGPERFDPPTLKQIARAWMEDMHDYCNVSHYLEILGDAHTDFMLRLRRFRSDHPWLRDNLTSRDHFSYAKPANGRVLFRSLRHGPDGEQIYAVSHLEGKSLEEVNPLDFDVPGLKEGDKDWQLALATPPIGADYSGGPITLSDSMGLVFVR